MKKMLVLARLPYEFPFQQVSRQTVFCMPTAYRSYLLRYFSCYCNPAQDQDTIRLVAMSQYYVLLPRRLPRSQVLYIYRSADCMSPWCPFLSSCYYSHWFLTPNPDLVAAGCFKSFLAIMITLSNAYSCSRRSFSRASFFP